MSSIFASTYNDHWPFFNRAGVENQQSTWTNRPMAVSIHPTAVVEDDVEIDDGTCVGAFCMIESGARIGRNNILHPGVFLQGSVRLGHGNTIQRGAALGGEPQSRSYAGEPGLLIIGDNNWLGENTTLHRGSATTGKTILGNDCFLMAGAHVAHDCRIGNGVTMTNNALAGGHVTLKDGVNMGAGAGCHQFVRVGELAMVAAMARVTQDVVPFALVANDNTLYGLNLVGIRRSIYPRAGMQPLKEAYRLFCRRREKLPATLAWLRDQPENPFLERWNAFLSEPSQRGYTRAERGLRTGSGDESPS